MEVSCKKSDHRPAWLWYFVLRIRSRSVICQIFLKLLKPKIHHDATVFLKNRLRYCLQTPSLRAAARTKYQSAGWLLVRGHGTGDGDTSRDGAAVSIQLLDSTTNMTAALTRRKAAEVGLELETNLRKVCSSTITEKDPTRAFSWLKAATTAAFTLN